MKTTLSISTLRRRAAKQGLVLRKVPERSRWYPTYGPFMLCEDGCIVAYAIDWDDVADVLCAEADD